MQGTNRQLLSLHREAQTMTGLIAIFNRSKIKQFYGDNVIRINTLNEKISKIQREFLVIEEGDKIRHEGEGNDRKPVIQEGKTREEFEAKLKDLLDLEIEIKC